MKNISNDRELAYWLQGHFEIGGKAELTEPQAKKIVFTVMHMKQKGDLADFVLKAFNVQEDLTLKADLQVAGQAIAAELNRVFVHTIDPEYAGTREQELHAIHGGGAKPNRPKPDNGLVAMC